MNWLAVYAILVEHCGATDREEDRRSFLWYMEKGDCREFRFMGHLGFGGKLYYRPYDKDRKLSVSCYPEDRTPKRAQMIERADAALVKLF